MQLVVINGPNLNLLGLREPQVYGNQSFEEMLADIRKAFPTIDIVYYQSNVEGELINKLHEVGFSADGIILNAGAYTHTSIAIADAIKSIQTSVVEVHISNVFARESYRHESFLTPVCKGAISGFGIKSYTLAIQSFLV